MYSRDPAGTIIDLLNSNVSPLLRMQIADLALNSASILALSSGGKGEYPPSPRCHSHTFPFTELMAELAVLSTHALSGMANVSVNYGKR